MLCSGLFAQAPETSLTKDLVESQLRFLASDDLQGRRTGEPGCDIAAKYIAETLRANGIASAPGTEDYFQNIDFVKFKTPASGSLTWGNTTYNHLNNMVILSGDPTDLEAKAVFVGYGLEDEAKGWNDYKGKKVEGKIVVAMGGVPDSQDPMAVFKSMKVKRDLAKSKGAVALIELYRLGFPWNFFKNYMTGDNLSMPEEGNTEEANPFTYAWLKEENEAAALELKKKKIKMQLSHTGSSKEIVRSQNVAGVIPGTDPKVQAEYIILTAHYDHVGTGKNGGSFYTPQDSIFNGARDNAMGTVALLSAAKTLAENPGRRPVLILAFTGEEMGLLGSRYYALNPLVPLRNTVFNFNTDGAGYNTKEAVSLIGWGRTGTNNAIETGAAAYGLKVIPDPAPDQNLFDRSDNVSFAAAGVPCANLAPGVNGFDDALMKYYHQAADNPESVDMDYLFKYSQTFAYISRLLADMDSRPIWKAGDKYEEAGKKLYGIQ